MSGNAKARLEALMQQKRAAQELRGNGAEQGWERETDLSCERYADGEYKYSMNDGRMIRISETFNELGTRVWDTAPMMAKYFEKNAAVSGKKVLELGSGTGLLGCVLAKLGAIVTLTEQPVLLAPLQENLSANCKDEVEAGTAVVQQLDWREDLTAFADDGHYDLIVASDCLVFSKDMPLLSKVLKQLVPQGSQTRLFIGSPLQRDGVQLFRTLTQSGFDCKDVPREDLDATFRSDRIVLFELSAK
jgi:predicted nicotinamide N-methyase